MQKDKYICIVWCKICMLLTNNIGGDTEALLVLMLLGYAGFAWQVSQYQGKLLNGSVSSMPSSSVLHTEHTGILHCLFCPISNEQT